MPKNAKSKKNSAKRSEVQKRELILAESIEGVVYGQVLRAVGDCNFIVKCADNLERLCHLRKSCKRSYVTVDAVVLVGTRDFQQEKGDIVYLYTYEEATKLRNMKEISFSLIQHFDSDNENGDDEDEKDVDFDFEEI